MDVFFECLVRKRSSMGDFLKRMGILMAAVVLGFAALFFVPGIGFLVFAGICYGAWYLFTMFNVEYEYILVNGEIDVDKIINQRKRKRLATVNVRNFTEFGRYHAERERLSRMQFATKLEVARDANAEDCWYAITDHPKFGRMLLLFTPNERMVNGCKEFLRRGVMKG